MHNALHAIAKHDRERHTRTLENAVGDQETKAGWAMNKRSCQSQAKDVDAFYQQCITFAWAHGTRQPTTEKGVNEENIVQDPFHGSGTHMMMWLCFLFFHAI
jgi:hypothetical protein